MLPPVHTFSDPAPLGSNPPSPNSGVSPKAISPFAPGAPMAIIPPEPLTTRQRLQDFFCCCFKPTLRETIYIGAPAPMTPMVPPRG